MLLSHGPSPSMLSCLPHHKLGQRIILSLRLNYNKALVLAQCVQHLHSGRHLSSHPHWNAFKSTLLFPCASSLGSLSLQPFEDGVRKVLEVSQFSISLAHLEDVQGKAVFSPALMAFLVKSGMIWQRVATERCWSLQLGGVFCDEQKLVAWLFEWQQQVVIDDHPHPPISDFLPCHQAL